MECLISKNMGRERIQIWCQFHKLIFRPRKQASLKFGPATSHNGCRMAKIRIFRHPDPSKPEKRPFSGRFWRFWALFSRFLSFYAFRRNWMRIFAVLRRLRAYSPQIFRRIGCEKLSSPPLVAWAKRRGRLKSFPVVISPAGA